MIILIAPPEYYALAPEQKADICNGCGAKGSRLPIPDTIWGLDVREACNIHDYYWHMGKDMTRSNGVFIANLVLLAVFAYLRWPKWLRWLAYPVLVARVLRAITYWLAVTVFGRGAYRRATQ